MNRINCASRKGFLDMFFLHVINAYQKYSVFIKGNSCRYYPTCSEYMKSAIQKYSFLVGILLGIKRILRCNQFFKGGFDPVP